MEETESVNVGWNSQREANNTQCDHGPVKGTIEKIKNIPGGWHSQKGVTDTKHDPCSAEDFMEETE